jgi:DNA-binding transcriptional ArsR family regulator
MLASARYSPTTEFLLSLKAYLDTTSHKMLDIGSGWPRQVAKRLPGDFDRGILAEVGMAYGLIDKCPTGDDPQAFISWLRDIPLVELYELVLSIIQDPARFPPDLISVRDRYVKALQIWYDSYFSAVHPAVHEALRESARTAAVLTDSLPPQAAIEEITGGIIMEPDQEVREVRLIPQYHYRPFNIFDLSGQTLMIAYPADLPRSPGAVPPDLRNLIRALDDESRLQILRYLAGGERNFTEIVKFIGLAKSTVHHHLVILRVSGLIRVHTKRTVAERYSLRPAAIDSFGPRLHAFLREE